mgnify:CR=1 FL=1
MLELVRVALMSNSNDQRRDAENTITQYRNTQPVTFIKDAIQNFVNADTPIELKQPLGVLLRQSVLLKVTFIQMQSPTTNGTLW